MRLSYEASKNEIISYLKNNKIWVLSTASKDNISSRSMSIINKGLNIYFQTNECYLKHSQMQENSKVSLCSNNISIEGIAEKIGPWTCEKNKELMELYKSVHLNSFNTYGLLNGQVVYKVTPLKIKIWKYIDGKPIRENIYVSEKKAEQLDFM